MLATVVHGARLGLHTIAVLMPQPNAAYVRKNLLLDKAHGATFVLTGSPLEQPIGLLRAMAQGFDRRTGKLPYVIPHRRVERSGDAGLRRRRPGAQEAGRRRVAARA